MVSVENVSLQFSASWKSPNVVIPVKLAEVAVRVPTVGYVHPEAYKPAPKLSGLAAPSKSAASYWNVAEYWLNATPVLDKVQLRLTLFDT